MERECQWCGRHFQAANFWSKARFCSNKCRCAWNADKRRFEKHLQRLQVDVEMLCTMYAHDRNDEYIAHHFNLIWLNVENAAAVVRDEE